ncbi:GNAT family N-acetyltransferase [Aureliella helgolandensis]|uniref:Putative acetyltransferase n=1 Tax=Aureliella helgolandensis TaxID=2527968 RepID=A0A518FZZ1_9BACT|nr:GNAT family N-acetyltransferase [Aureliella helgolandensis]QDV21886.1 putative acetyltransferase [Aureliella helgolandensis]
MPENVPSSNTPLSRSTVKPEVAQLVIRHATLADAAKIVDFNCAISRETEGKELDREVVARGVARGIRQGDEVTYFVAEADQDLAGCLMLTREWSDWRDGWLVWIQSVYVTQEFRGRGVFRRLLETATERVQQDPDVVGLRLYVEVENERAQQVYRKTGFQDPNYKVLEKLF